MKHGDVGGGLETARNGGHVHLASPDGRYRGGGCCCSGFWNFSSPSNQGNKTTPVTEEQGVTDR